MPRDLELLEIGKEQLLRAVAARGGDGEDLLPSASSESPARRAMRSAMTRSLSVLVGERNRIVSAMMPAASRPASFGLGMTPRSWNMEVTIVQVLPTGLVAHVDRAGGLHVRQAVVVDDLHDLRLLEAGDGLRRLVVVHEHDALAVGPEQVVSATACPRRGPPRRARVAAVARAQRDLAHVVEEVVQVKATTSSCWHRPDTGPDWMISRAAR